MIAIPLRKKRALLYDVQHLVLTVLGLSESVTTFRIRLVDHRQMDNLHLIVDVKKMQILDQDFLRLLA